MSDWFGAIEPARRATGLRAIWREADGEGPLDLICVTHAGFEQARSRISPIAAVLPEAIDLLPVDPDIALPVLG